MGVLAVGTGGGGGWHEALVLVCLPLAAPIGLSVGGGGVRCLVLLLVVDVADNPLEL